MNAPAVNTQFPPNTTSQQTNPKPHLPTQPTTKTTTLQQNQPAEPLTNTSPPPYLTRLLIPLATLLAAVACQPPKTENNNPNTSQQNPTQNTNPKTTTPPRQYHINKTITHTGACDGSAGVALDKNHFLVANDENNTLRIYHRTQTTAPLSQIDLRPFLNLKKNQAETDLEGMTRIGKTIYLIASHSRSKNGEKRKSRHQLFALSYTQKQNKIRLLPFGKPYTKLIQALETNPTTANWNIAKAARQPNDKPNALNIEGLSAKPDGGLLIGFRSPKQHDKTILITLNNPLEIMAGAPPSFGKPTLLTLHGMGIRGMEHFQNTYLLIVKAEQKNHPAQLFSWDGNTPQPQRIFAPLPAQLNPESILIFPNTGWQEIHLLIDDSNEKLNSKPCNEIKKPAQQQFRRLILRSTNH